MKYLGKHRHGKRVLFCSLCAFLLVWSATAQEPEIGVEPDPAETPESADESATDDSTVPPILPHPETPDIQEEMRQIFRRVEIKLRDIDVLLTDAGAGDTRRLQEVGEAGLDELLRRSIREGREVQREIDELLQLAQQAGGGGGGSSSSSQSQQSGQGQSGNKPSPLDQGSGQQRSQEATPTLPEQQPGGEQGQQPDGQQPGGEQEGEQTGQPEGKQPGEGDKPGDGPEQPDPDPKNEADDDPDPDETSAPGARADLNERWGELPVHVRDVFRTEGGEDMPPEYRDWIDAYYRKLNERAAQGR